MIDRITILGGSSVYTPEFLLAAISRNLHVKQIVLMGHAGRKLELVAAFCRRLIKKSGFPVEIIASSDIREAAIGAKYILNHIRVGGMQARMRDEILPPKYGMVGHEALGAGGLTNALRTLPVVFEYAAAIEEVNPNCTFINLSNPIGIIVEGLIKCSKLRVLGVCDLPGTYSRKVAKILQKNLDDIRIDYIGLNHMGWIQDVKIDNRSRMSQILELLEQQEEEEFDRELIQLFRMIPTRQTGYYFHRGDIAKRQKASSRARSEVLHEAEKRILKLYEDEHLCELPDLTRQRNALWYDETILPLIETLEQDKERMLVLCVRNNNSIRDLPDDSSVEIPTAVCAKGVQPRKVGSLPRFLRGLYLAAKESDRLIVEAVRHHSYECALQAMAINPFVPSLETAKKYLGRVIKDEKINLY